MGRKKRVRSGLRALVAAREQERLELLEARGAPVPPDGPLAPDEAERLEALEAVVHRGLRSFIEVGEALAEIRARRLYRVHGTFEEYCRVRWRMSRQRAYQLEGAARVARRLEPMVPRSERQARALRRLPVAWQRRAMEVAEAAAERAGRVDPRLADVETAVAEQQRWLVAEGLVALPAPEPELPVGRGAEWARYLAAVVALPDPPAEPVPGWVGPAVRATVARHYRCFERCLASRGTQNVLNHVASNDLD